MSTDKDWEQWGATDPYFGVLSSEDFRSSNLTENSINKFFASGETHIDDIFTTIEQHFPSPFKPGKSLDFGSGVGRVLIPIARRSEHAVGVDISPSMLKLAADHCREMHIDNVTLSLSDEQLTSIGSDFDFIHSVVVFCHIPTKKGLKLIDKLAAKTSKNGIMAIQVLSKCTAPRLVRFLVRLSYSFPPLNIIRNLLRRRPWNEPRMQLHEYDLSDLTSLLYSQGFSRLYLMNEKLPNGDFIATFVIAQKDA